jgi:hypothetical protein
MPLENPWDEAVAAWTDFQAAAQRIQAAANRIKDTERSFDGYEIERTLRKHKPELIKTHLDNLKEHRKANSL